MYISFYNCYNTERRTVDENPAVNQLSMPCQEVSRLLPIQHIKRRSASFSGPTMNGPSVQQCYDMSNGSFISLSTVTRNHHVQHPSLF